MRLFICMILCALCFCPIVQAQISFLTLSDIHYGSSNTSADGSDTGDALLNLTLNKLKQLSKQVDFILYLGDLPTHHILGNSPLKGNYEKVVFHGLFMSDAEKKPIFYISGNNDSLFGNYQPFSVEGKSPLNYATDWTGACAYCEGLMIDDSHMQEGAYYSSYVIEGNKDIVLVVLNSTQWMRKIFLVPRYLNQEKDAALQLNWFREQMKNHHAKQILIAMHEPPGNNFKGKPFWEEQYLQEFISIIEQNQKNYGEITLLTAHTHKDEFRKITLASGKSIYAYSTPSISRLHENNPGIKIFTLDNSDKVKDFTTYYTPTNLQWGNDQYHALTSPDSIFPDCQMKTLADCLNGLNDVQVCNYLAAGLFYGVKSPRVDNKECGNIYKIQ